jgi:hypothetical protein
MIAVIKNKEQIERPFPKLRVLIEDDNLVVYFTSLTTGSVVLDGEGTYKFGFTNVEWGPEEFVDFEGIVELRNDWVEPI